MNKLIVTLISFLVFLCSNTVISQAVAEQPIDLKLASYLKEKDISKLTKEQVSERLVYTISGCWRAFDAVLKQKSLKYSKAFLDDCKSRSNRN